MTKRKPRRKAAAKPLTEAVAVRQLEALRKQCLHDDVDFNAVVACVITKAAIEAAMEDL